MAVGDAESCSLGRSEAATRKGVLAQTTPLPGKWPNGVPYIDEEARKEAMDDPVTLRDLICTMDLHRAYRGRSFEVQMTTEQKELYADVLEWNAATNGETYAHDRWWQR